MEWQPIDTAPMDGTWILVHGFKFGREKCVSHWYAVVQWEPISKSRPELGGQWLYGQHKDLHVRDPQYWTYLPAVPEKNVSRETLRGPK